MRKGKEIKKGEEGRKEGRKEGDKKGTEGRKDVDRLRCSWRFRGTRALLRRVLVD